MNNQERHRPPYGRLGNKYQMIDDILDSIPPQNHIYVELFCGSGAVFFNKPKQDINILNDLDKTVTHRLNLIKRAPLNPERYHGPMDSINQIKTFFNNHQNTVPDLILYERIKSNCGFSGNNVNESKDIYKSIDPTQILDNMAFYKKMLMGVQIINKDYREVIEMYDTKDTFFYLDPPYEDSKNLYTHHHIDYEEMRDILSNLKGKFLLSINNSTYIRKLFKGFRIKRIDVSSNIKNGQIRKELLIMNY